MQRNRDLIIGVSLLVVGFIGLGMLVFQLAQGQSQVAAEPSVTIVAGVTVTESEFESNPIPTAMPQQQTQLAVLNDKMQDAVIAYQTATPAPTEGCMSINVTIGAGATEDITIDAPKSLWTTDYGVPITVMNAFTNPYLGISFEAEAYAVPDFNLMGMYKEVVDVNMYILPPGTYTIGVLSAVIDGVVLHTDTEPTVRTLYLCERFQN